MTTRFDANSKGLRSGYDNSNYSSDISIPACGIEDVDRAIFHLFDKELPLQINSKDGLRPAKAIFAAGEKWAVLKKKKSIRDRQGRLILPLVSIGRTGIKQDISTDITGRGINQQTGELRIQRRLSSNDRGYQNNINRLLIKNQLNVAANADQGIEPITDQLSTEREIGELTQIPDIVEGGFLAPARDDNVWETITIPAPQFFSAQYEVTFWTQYAEHMVDLIEQFISAQLPQGNAFRIANPENNQYWFVATVDGNEFTPEDNFGDMAEQERLIKYTFTMNVPAYIIASNAPGIPVPVRRYISSTNIEFKTDIGPVAGVDEIRDEKDPWLGADDPTLPYDHDTPSRLLNADQRRNGYPRTGDRSKVHADDPALLGFPRGIQPARYMKVKTLNSDGSAGFRRVKLRTTNQYSGESTFSAEEFSLGGLSLIVTDE